MDECRPHGVWGLAPGALPDEAGNWKPNDLWFYGPGDTPPHDNWKPQGLWTYPPGSNKKDWPPLAKEAEEEAFSHFNGTNI